MRPFSDYFTSEEADYIVAVMHVRHEGIDRLGEMFCRNIASVLPCRPEKCERFSVLHGGLSNLSLRFSLEGRDYVYRHPGYQSELFINRRCEAHANAIGSRLGLDKSFIYLDPDQGWKVSYFIPDARVLDYHSPADVKQALRIMKTLHRCGEKTLQDFLVWDEAVKIYDTILAYGKERYVDFTDLFTEMTELAARVEKDEAPLVLCHGDCWQPNYLFSSQRDGDGVQESVSIIDWEFSGNSDPGFDLGTFLCCSDYTSAQALDVIQQYYDHHASAGEIRHMLALAALSSYYWFLYGLFLQFRGTDAEEFVTLWYDHTLVYAKEVLPYYAEEKRTVGL